VAITITPRVKSLSVDEYYWCPRVRALNCNCNYNDSWLAERLDIIIICLDGIQRLLFLFVVALNTSSGVVGSKLSQVSG
jgi:hypothetical protein